MGATWIRRGLKTFSVEMPDDYEVLALTFEE